MKIKKGFTLRSIAGEDILVAEGVEQVDFNYMVAFNKSAALLWRAFEGKEFSTADLAKALVDHYGIDQAKADADARSIAKEWIDADIVEA